MKRRPLDRPSLSEQKFRWRDVPKQNLPTSFAAAKHTAIAGCDLKRTALGHVLECARDEFQKKLENAVACNEQGSARAILRRSQFIRDLGDVFSDHALRWCPARGRRPHASFVPDFQFGITEFGFYFLRRLALPKTVVDFAKTLFNPDRTLKTKDAACDGSVLAGTHEWAGNNPAYLLLDRLQRFAQRSRLLLALRCERQVRSCPHPN